ncbi:MAG: hypothetical protein IJ849_04755 [Selenomonadaceae bacterium]|nr:hypothetical protein [Selenomonadaceae bacterium]
MSNSRKRRPTDWAKQVKLGLAAGLALSLPYSAAEATTLTEYEAMLSDGLTNQSAAATDAVSTTTKTSQTAIYESLVTGYKNLASYAETQGDTAKQAKYKALAEKYQDAIDDYDSTYSSAVTNYSARNTKLDSFATAAKQNGIFVTQKDPATTSETTSTSTTAEDGTVTTVTTTTTTTNNRFANGTYTGVLVAGGMKDNATLYVYDSTINAPSGADTAVWVTDSPDGDTTVTDGSYSYDSATSTSTSKNIARLNLTDVTINGGSTVNAVTVDSGYLYMSGNLNITGDIVVNGKDTNLGTTYSGTHGTANIHFDEGSTLTNTGIYATAERSLENYNSNAAGFDSSTSYYSSYSNYYPSILGGYKYDDTYTSYTYTPSGVGVINLYNDADTAFDISSGDYAGTNDGGNYLALGSSGKEAGTINLQQGKFIINDIRREGYGTDTLTTRYSSTSSSPTVNILDGATLIREVAFPTVSGDKNFLRIKDGRLETTSNIIFTNAATASVTDPGSILTNANDTIGFDSGFLQLDDSQYNLTYAKAAADKLTATASGTYSYSYYDPDYEGGGTALVMTGALVDTSGSAVSAVNFSDLSSYTDRLFLDGVAISAEKQNLTIDTTGSTSSTDTTAVSSNSVYASQLYLPKVTDSSTAHEVNVTSGTLSLGGTSDAALISTEDSADVTLKVAGGSVNVGGVAVDIDNGTPSYTLGATVEVSNGGSLSVARDATLTVTKPVTAKDGSLTASGTLKVSQTDSSVADVTATNSSVTVNSDGAIYADTLTLTNDSSSTAAKSTLTIYGGTVNNAAENGTGVTLKADSGTAINVYDGTLVLDSDSSLTGATVFLDPSTFAAAGTDVDYALEVGAGSTASLGTTDTSLATTALTDAGVSEGDTAVLYLDSPITLANTGRITVDNSMTTSAAATATANTVNFAADSLLLVNAKNLGTSAAITSTDSTGGASFTVANGSQLYLNNATAGQTYTIASGFGTTDYSGWTATNAVKVNRLIDGTFNTASGTVTTSQKFVAQSTLAGTLLANNLDSMIAGGQNDTASTNVAIRDMSNLIEWGADPAATIAFTNNLATAPESVGATAIGAHQALSSAETALDHLSLLNVDEAHTADVWVKLNRSRLTGDNMDLSGGDTGFRNNYFGFVAGMDFKGSGEKYKSGVYFNYGTGSAAGGIAHDDSKSWGLGYYGNFINGRNNLIFDVSYQQTEHDITAGIYNPAQLAYQSFDASPKNQVFSLGLREEYVINQGKVDFIPHVGLRYMNISTPDYSGSLGGATYMHYRPGTRSVVMLPVGIGMKYKSDKSSSGWVSQFSGDIGYRFALSGRDGHMDVNLDGLSGRDNIDYGVVDRSTFYGALGWSMKKNDDIVYGISYNYAKGSSFQDNRLMLSFQCKF